MVSDNMRIWYTVERCLKWMFRFLILTSVIMLIIECPSFFMDFLMNRWTLLDRDELQTLIKEYKVRLIEERASLTPNTLIDIISEAPTIVDEKTAELHRIHNFIYTTLDKLQNDGDCEQKKIVRCTNSMMSGFGSTIHRHVICLHIAFALGRAFFIDQEGYEQFNGLANFTKIESGKCSYLKKTLKDIKDRCNFNDLNCYINKDGFEINNDYKLLEFTREAVFPAPKYIPGTLPNNINKRLQKLGVKTPYHWFTSQLLGYMIMRPNEVFGEKYKSVLLKTNFGHPLVGVHFRGTDKVYSESRYVSLDNYMNKAVGVFNDKLNASSTRYIYVASDDTRILRKTKNDLNDSYVIKGNPLGHDLRLIGRRDDTSRDVMEKILMDLYFLARCDYAIVTYSSNIGRLVWELKTSQFPYDAGDTIISMDYANIFYAWYAYEVTTYFLSTRGNSQAVVAGRYTIMAYEKGQLYHNKGQPIRTVIINGVPRKIRFVRLYRKDVNIGYVFENDLVFWPGNVHYKNDMGPLES